VDVRLRSFDEALVIVGIHKIPSVLEIQMQRRHWYGLESVAVGAGRARRRTAGKPMQWYAREGSGSRNGRHRIGSRTWANWRHRNRAMSRERSVSWTRWADLARDAYTNGCTKASAICTKPGQLWIQIAFLSLGSQRH